VKARIGRLPQAVVCRLAAVAARDADLFLIACKNESFSELPAIHIISAQ
jgi:hypothetical protein